MDDFENSGLFGKEENEGAAEKETAPVNEDSIFFTLKDEENTVEDIFSSTEKAEQAADSIFDDSTTEPVSEAKPAETESVDDAEEEPAAAESAGWQEQQTESTAGEDRNGQSYQSYQNNQGYQGYQGYQNNGGYQGYQANQGFQGGPNYQNPYGYQNGGYTPYQSRQAGAYTPEGGTAGEPAADGKKRGRSLFFAVLSIVLVIALIFSVGSIVKTTRKKHGGTVNNGSGYVQSDDESTPEVGTEVIPLHPAKSSSKALTVEQIAEKARESCVGILVYYQKAYTSSEAGQGTGILSLESGGYTYIITCAHVISDAGISVKVQLEDGTSFDDAEIVGFDTRTDVGVVRIKATGLPLAELGDSTQLKVGASVFAVGNPGGIEFFGSFTDGIVSAIDRPIDSEIGYTMNCIQHTAAINPGNSGGALVNSLGQVIGVNSQKIASADYEGMGFAIPINQAAKIAQDLINHGYVPNRAKLGITYYSISASRQISMIAQFNQLPAGTLVIDTISEDSSLYGTEVKQYDMIIAVDGEALTTADVLLEKIDNGKVGDKHTLTVARVNSNYTLEKFDVQITLVEDKGGSVPTEATTAFNPFSDFGDFGDFGF